MAKRRRKHNHGTNSVAAVPIAPGATGVSARRRLPVAVWVLLVFPALLAVSGWIGSRLTPEAPAKQPDAASAFVASSRTRSPFEPGPDRVLLGYLHSKPVFDDDIGFPPIPLLDLDVIPTVSNTVITYQTGDRTMTFRFHDVLAMTPRELEDLPAWPLEVFSVMAPVGLPGYDLETDGRIALERVQALARYAAARTERDRQVFARYPERFNHSEAQFRMTALVTYLRRDAGIFYDPEHAKPPDMSQEHDEMDLMVKGDTFWEDPDRLFLHGVFQGHGTCSSLPILTVVVGRLMGYPLKFAITKQHLFARWEEPGEVFNIECTGPAYASFPDDYYRSWPYPVSPEEEKRFGFLKTLTRGGELALLLHNRGLCLLSHGRRDEAYAWVVKGMDLHGIPDFADQLLKQYLALRDEEILKARYRLLWDLGLFETAVVQVSPPRPSLSDPKWVVVDSAPRIIRDSGRTFTRVCRMESATDGRWREVWIPTPGEGELPEAMQYGF